MIIEKVKIKKLDKNAKIPSYGTSYAAGADLYALTDDTIVVSPGETKLIKTGIALEIPIGYVGLVYARSGLATKMGLAPSNKVGVIDSDYRGELMVSIYNQSKETREIENGERIAQLVIAPYIKASFEETDELDETKRGSNGFGSTGKK